MVRWTGLAIAILASGCASTTAHFHTLVPETDDSRSQTSSWGVNLAVAPVRVPAQVDRLELVTRQPDGDMVIADGERWVAPVADELHDAFSAELLRWLGDPDAGRPIAPASVVVRLDVERFESRTNSYALIEASWHLEVKEAGRIATVVCRSRAYEALHGGGYPELVRGYQRAVAGIAGDIALTARNSFRGAYTECPEG